MNFMMAIKEFLPRKFPGLGGCQFCFEPETRTIYVRCPSPERRAVAIKDAQAIACLDIGVERFVIVHPNYPDVTIQHIDELF
jgi:hypothetical protein